MSVQHRLVTIPISHYCEKARWALERAGIPYEERAHLQALHRVAVRRAGGGKTAPVLVCPDRVLADSADILAYADERAPAGRGLYPDDEAAATEVRSLERVFDERLGPHGRLWMYFRMRGSRDLAIAYGCTGVPTWERRAMPYFYPLMSAIVDRVLGVSEENARESEAEVRTVFDMVDERLADGRRYLCADRFTAADLTFSALAAAVLVPPEYGVPLPQPPELPAPMRELTLELRERPAGKHALGMYRQERRLEPVVAGRQAA